MNSLSSVSGKALFLLTALIVSLSSASAFGSGFALIEQSVTGLGNAFAGGSAIAEDASTIFFNPAGLTRLDGIQLLAAANVVIPSVKFSNQGSTQVLQPITGIPLLGGNGGDGGVTKVVPNLYYSIKISDRLSAGIGINAPFGLATKYDDTWVGRYHAIESDLLSVNINPSIAYRIGDHLSVGAGFNAMYIKAKLTNAIDYGTIDAVGGFSPAIPPGTFRLTPQRSDGSASLEGDSWGLGFNVGLLYEFTKDTRLGVAYRSRVKQTIEGDAEFFNTPAALAPLPAFKNTSAQAEITLPDSFSVSFAHSFNPQWTVMADFTWTNWSLFKELRVHFDNPNQPDSVTTENWQDSYRYSLGVTFKPTNAWTLRTGFAYDTSAVSSAQFRTPRIPDSYRTWLAFGLSYKFSKTIGIDAGYSHLWISDPAIDQNPVGENALRGGLKGSFDAHIDIIAAQLNVAF